MKITWEKILNYGILLTIFLLPWQTRWIFGQLTIAGEPFQYGILSIYAVEVLIWMLFLARLFISKEVKKMLLPFFIIIFLGIQTIFSDHNILGFTTLFHLASALAFFLLVLFSKMTRRPILLAFCTGLIIPALLGIWQVVFGFSLASTLFGLAERNAQILGDAVLLVDGQRLLRAYGSFSHPNIFGGYLAVGVFSSFWLFLTSTKQKEKVLITVLGLFLLMALVLTFSRSAMIGLFIALIISIIPFFKSLKRFLPRQKIGVLILFLISATLIFYSGNQLWQLRSGSDLEAKSVNERIVQYQEFPDVMQGNWLLGTGVGQYTYAIEKAFPEREWWEYQPIHNSFLLALGEIGILGLVMIFGSLFSISKFLKWRLTIFSTGILGLLFIIGLFDHYLWSQWSGLILISILLTAAFFEGKYFVQTKMR